MTQRGRGSGPSGDNPDDEDAAVERTAERYPMPPTASRPIVPYDPYRPPPGETSRISRRNVAAEDLAPEPRPASRVAGSDPFLPDDDPLSADAWQLELDELDAPASPGADPADTLPDFDLTTPPPRARRQSAAAAKRVDRESRSAAGRAPRRGRTPAAGARGRAVRPSFTLGMPRVVAGSSLVTDQTVLLLLGINAASILVMALLLGVRLGALPSPAVLQLDAAGNPALWGAPGVLWRLPMMSFFITAIFVAVAWFVHPIDRFAARFALAAALLAQVVAWVAVIQHLA
ncbi:MAG: hypothetical protein H0V00_05305 [Chloroflexia bacterium]|nr:hypothetical protein [Chloroflexia bacterium]